MFTPTTRPPPPSSSDDPRGPPLSSRGAYGPGGAASHIGGRHGNGRLALPDVGGPDRKPRAGGLCAVAHWTTLSRPANGSALGSSQPANRKAQSGRQLPSVGMGEVEGQPGAVRELWPGVEEEEEEEEEDEEDEEEEGEGEEEEDTSLLEVLDQDDELISLPGTRVYYSYPAGQTTRYLSYIRILQTYIYIYLTILH